MVIYTREQISSEVFKISSDMGSAFFIHTAYLSLVSPEEIQEAAEFLDEKEDEILDAGLSFAVQRKAEEYLSRAEQCRFALTQKLLKKGYEKKHIEKALDYLEGKNYLNDTRFSLSWLNSRKINHFEGRTRLLAELLSRGISKIDANTALDEFFTDNSEYELALSCYEKIKRTSKNSSQPLEKEKIVQKMLKNGFSWSLIKEVLSDYS